MCIIMIIMYGALAYLQFLFNIIFRIIDFNFRDINFESLVLNTLYALYTN